MTPRKKKTPRLAPAEGAFTCVLCGWNGTIQFTAREMKQLSGNVTRFEGPCPGCGNMTAVKTERLHELSPTYDELMACLAEGQARIMTYMVSAAHFTSARPHEKKAMEEKWNEATQAMLEWAMSRDDINVKPNPLKAVWAFRLRAFDAAHGAAIKNLEEAIATLKAQRPREPP